MSNSTLAKGRQVTKLSKLLRSSAAVAVTALLAMPAFAQTAVINNWVNSTGQVWKNGSGECWRNSSWTPATAAPACDGAIASGAGAVAAKAAPAVAPVPAPKPSPAMAVTEKTTFSTEAFFDFNKIVLKPEGKAQLDALIAKIKNINLEVVVAVGHTDNVGSDAYNKALSLKRAEAVKAYLVSNGIERNRVYADGKGESQPVADNKTEEGRAKNRRVELEVVGTRTIK